MKYNRLIVVVTTLAGSVFVRGYAEESPWPMFRHDLRHTGRSTYTGPATPNLHWVFPANDGIASSPAIGPDGTIYVGGGWYFGGASDSCLYAINPDGSLKWCFKTGHGVFSSPTIGLDGTIYVGSLDKHLYAIEDSITYGKLRWKTHLGWWIYSSPAIGADGSIYVGSLNFNFYTLNPDGTIKWSYPTAWCIFSSPAIGIDGTVYVGSKDEHLYAFEDSVTYGKVRWKYATGQFYDGYLVDSSPLVGPDGTIYVGTDPYGAAGYDPVPVDTVFFAIKPDGTLKWRFPMDDGAESSPAIGTDGTIYVGSYDGYLYAITDSGSQGVLKWKFATGGPIDGSPAVDGCGTIYIGSKDSTLYAINSDGTLRWSFRADGGIESSPTIGGNGILYFGSFDGSLYALGTGAPDVGVVSVDIPDQVNIDSTYLPAATVRNYRAAPQSFNLACLIDTQDHYVYGDTVYVELVSGGMVQAIFSPWTTGPDTGMTYSVSVVTLLSEDDNVLNDTILKDVVSVLQVPFIRGDADGSGALTLGDGLWCFRCQFVPGWQDSCKCDDAVDADDNGALSIGDCLHILRKQFVPGWQDSIPPPCCTAPGDCGVDPTDDGLRCEEHPCMGDVTTDAEKVKSAE